MQFDRNKEWLTDVFSVKFAETRLDNFFSSLIKNAMNCDNDFVNFNGELRDWFTIKRELFMYREKSPALEFREKQLKKNESEVLKVKIDIEKFKAQTDMFCKALENLSMIDDENERKLYVSDVICAINKI